MTTLAGRAFVGIAGAVDPRARDEALARASATLLHRGVASSFRSKRAEVAAVIFGANEVIEEPREIVAGLSPTEYDAAPSVRARFDGDAVELRADAFGRRSLYVAARAGIVVFATELRAVVVALRALGHPPSLDAASLRRFLSFSFVPAPRTPFRDVVEVPAAHRVSWSSRSGLSSPSRWFDTPSGLLDAWDDRTAALSLGAALEESVARHAARGRSRVLFLSSGLDSAAIAATHRRLCGPIATLTIDHEEESEAEIAAEVATHLALPHERLRVAGADVARCLPEVIRSLDVPVGDPVVAPFFLAARATSFDEAWNGEGGDQLFAGWATKPMLAWASYAAPDDDVSAAYVSTFHKLADVEEEAFGDMVRADRSALTDDLAPFLTGERAARHPDFFRLLCDANLWLKCAGNLLPRIERTCASAGKEAVSPIVDDAVVRAAFALTTSQKQRGTTEKWILRELLRDVLPKSVIDRPKRGMKAPLRAWWSSSLGELARDVLTSRACRERGVLRPSFVDALLADDVRAPDLRKRRRDEWLWLALVTEMWLAEHALRSPSVRAPWRRRIVHRMGAVFGELSTELRPSSLASMARALRPRVAQPSASASGPASICGTFVEERGGSVVGIDAATLSRDGVLASVQDFADAIFAHGPSAAMRTFDGSFGVSFWDGATQRLSLARDATGQRCLTYARTRRGLAFASEPKALLARRDVDRSLDPLALLRYLSMAYLPGEATLVRAVREVPPGTVVVFDQQGDEVHRDRFWSPREPSDLASLSLDVAPYAANLRRTLDDVIGEYRASTDDLGPSAAFLSGGLDSSLVVALASRGAPPPVCFSISFGDDLPNELAFSSALAKHVGAEHEIVTVSFRDMGDRLRETIYHLDDPIGDPLTVPNYLLAARAKVRGFRRVWNGEGGDPCFGGPKNIPMMLAEQYGDVPEGGRERAYLSAYQKLFDDLATLLHPEVLREATRDEDVGDILTPFFDDPATTSFLNKLQTINLVLKGGSHILVKVDKMYGAHGLLPLSPLFDRRVAERAWETPPSLKLRGNVEKFVLKEAVKDVVPRSIIERKKSGMLVPVHPWFQGPLRDLFHDTLGPSQVKRRGLFRPEAIAKMIDYRGASSVRGFYGAKLWVLLTLEVWMSLFLDGDASRFETE